MGLLFPWGPRHAVVSVLRGCAEHPAEDEFVPCLLEGGVGDTTLCGVVRFLRCLYIGQGFLISGVLAAVASDLLESSRVAQDVMQTAVFSVGGLAKGSQVLAPAVLHSSRQGVARLLPFFGGPCVSAVPPLLVPIALDFFEVQEFFTVGSGAVVETDMG